MKNSFLSFILIFCFIGLYGQQKKEMAVKIGGNYYINCKHLIKMNGEDLVNVNASITDKMGVFLHVYNETGNLILEVKDGKVEMNSGNLFSVTNTPKEFLCIEKKTGKKVCYIKKQPDKTHSGEVYAVWADIMTPKGYSFQCTPETTNIPALQYMTGSTFDGAETAITLN